MGFDFRSMLDFIERYFGVAPDNGNGSVEFLLVMFLIMLILAIALRLLAVILPTK
jgi:hypothetical protein